MKVNFFSATLLAALSVLDKVEAVPLHTMSTANTDAGLQISLNALSDSGSSLGEPVTFTLGDGEM